MLHGKDMFHRTQTQLTRIYSGLLILFLMLFIVIMYSVLYITITKNAERELRSLVAEEASFIENYLVENQINNFRGVQTQEIVFAGVNQTFYYVVNKEGDIILGNDEDSRLQSTLSPLLYNHFTSRNNGNLFYESIHLEGIRKDKAKVKEFNRPESEMDIHLMIASHPVIYKGQFIGQLYIGKDFTFAHQLFQWVLIILVVLGIVFLGLAIFISHKMSKKAMVPISNAFSRQREFVADASHELRTPLAVLQSSIDALDMTVDTGKDDFTEKLFSNMRMEVKRMTNLVGDLLTLARSDSKTVELRKEQFDFFQVSEKTLASVRPLADSKGIFTKLVACGHLQMVGDPERLSQLLYILLDNAIKYTPSGGEVQLSISQEGLNLCIEVQDTGIGIKNEDLERIFERFYRSDKSRSRQMGGHGLGLSIAKWIVEMHKGTIVVSSEHGKGSTFVVKLPVLVDYKLEKTNDIDRHS